MISFNEYMHPRNIYKTPLNFEELCSQYPEIMNYVHKKPNGKIIFDFKNRDGLRCLSTVLLKRDFDLQITIPENTLIPTLPLRLNYILWIEDLLQYDSKDIACGKQIKGIDIGTGATCIYPLLITKKNGWKMLAIDIKEDIIEMARKNIEENHLDHLISVVKVSSSSAFLEPTILNQKYDFCMCNPPFFDSSEYDLNLPTKRNRAKRRREARLQASGTSNEISSPGGEVAFLKKIIEDSKIHQDFIKIYTTMIGCKSSVQPVIDILKENEIGSYCKTQFCQGRTMRWAIAWTFTDMPMQSSSLLLPPKKKPQKPLVWNLQSKLNFQECVDKMNLTLEELQVEFDKIKQNKNTISWKIRAHRNTWTGMRKLRRKQQRNEFTHQSSSVNEKTSCATSSVENVTNYASNKRKVSLEHDACSDEHLQKRLKMNVSSEALTLEAEIELKQIHQNADANISIRVTFIKGQKEAPQQILQYFKNILV